MANQLPSMIRVDVQADRALLVRAGETEHRARLSSKASTVAIGQRVELNTEPSSPGGARVRLTGHVAHFADRPQVSVAVCEVGLTFFVELAPVSLASAQPSREPPEPAERAPRSEPRTALSGNLFEMPLIDVMQALGNRGGCARVALVPEDGVVGAIHVDGGIVVWAERGALRGDAALRSLLRVERGTFGVAFGVDLPGRNVSAATARPLRDDVRHLNAARSLFAFGRSRSIARAARQGWEAEPGAARGEPAGAEIR